MSMMQLVCGYGVCLFMALLAGTLLIFIWMGRINLYGRVSEANGAASMSRFQLLIFTLVVAISLFILVEKGGRFPEIPDGVLTLLGISASTYAVGKGISYSREEGVTTPEERAMARATGKAVSDTGAGVVSTPAGVASTGATDV